MESKRDYWSKIEVISKIVGVILIPIILFCIGNKFNTEKENTNANQRDFQNTIELLNLCNSTNENLRTAGFEYAHYLKEKKLLDTLLIPILLKKQAEEPNSETARKTGEIIEDITSKSKSAKELDSLDSKLVSRVYMHINNESQRTNATKLISAIESDSIKFKNGIKTPGIEFKNYNFNKTQLRIFNQKDSLEGNKIIRILKNSGINIELIDLSKRYPNSKIRPRHFEIWFGNEFK